MEYTFTKFEKRTVLLASCLAIFVNPLAGSMLNLALGAIQADFHCSEHELGWVSSVYFIISVMCVLPAAKLSDIYGKKKMFLLGAVFACAGAILSMMSQNIIQLYIFRGITAVGAAFISSTCVAMIADVYAPHERGGALGINTACVYLGASLGPTIGGIMTENFGWKSIFLILIPLLVVAFIALCFFPHNIKNTPDSKFDSAGTALFAVATVITMFGIISLPNIYAVIMIVIGLALTLVFIRMERNVENPIFKGELFRNVSFRRSMLALFLNYAASFCVAFFLSRYLQEIGAMTPTEAGLFLAIQPMMQVIFTLICGKLSDKMDKRILPTAGLTILSLGLVLLMFLDETVNKELLIASMVIMGIGYGMFSAPNTNAVMSYVKRSEYNAASGLISATRQIGMMISMGMATCLIAIFLGTETMLEPSNYHTFMDILRTAWIICICFSLIGAFVSWFRGSSMPAEE